MKEFWDERYSAENYAYGEKPNQFLEENLPKFEKGKILFPADGEGRNSVFAARLGWEVSAFDMSEEGIKKARRLAEKSGVKVDYKVGDLKDLHYFENEFDAIADIFSHFPSDKKKEYYQILNSYLKKNGLIILELYHKNQLEINTKNPKSGGPRSLEMLYSKEDILELFPNFEILLLEETTNFFDEGDFHNGEGAVVKFIGRKI